MIGGAEEDLAMPAKKAGSDPLEGRRSPPEPAERRPEADEPGPENRHRARTRALLRLGTPLAAMLLTLFSPLARLLVERLPRLQPIALVLVIFFAVLGLSVLLQLYLHWRDLKTAEARIGFLRTLAYGLFLFAVMVGGMFARYFWELFQSGYSLAQADVRALLLPLLVSLMVFYPLWTMVSGTPKNFFAIVAAFQNGFFWQIIFSGLNPVPVLPGS
jgi:hypothetical protein